MEIPGYRDAEIRYRHYTEIEIVILAFFGYMSYLIGMKMDYVGYEFFFYILTAIFFFSIFRPKASP